MRAYKMPTSMGLRRTTALFLIITFLATHFSPSVYAQSSKGALRTQDSHSPAIRPKALAALSLPSEMGKIEERFTGPQDRLVILIQDAHSAGEAQKSMRKIIGFYEQQGVRLITAEGAAGKMDTELFRAFPDRHQLEHAFDFYLNAGELSGAAASAVLSTFPSDYYGIEDKKLYQEGVRLFLRALDRQPALLKKLDAHKLRIQALKEKHYSKKLLEVDRALEKFSERHDGLANALTSLAAVRRPEKGSALEMLLEEITSGKGRWTKDESKLQKKFEAIQGSRFQEEFEAYSESVKQSLFRNDEERRINARAEKIRLLEHLIQLKLTRKEWGALNVSFRGLKGREISEMASHRAFYLNAEAREEVFQKNLSHLMMRHKTPAAIFVAGGFHSSAMAQHLREAGISYLLISPAIKELPEEGLYLEHMRGGVSWKNYFQIKDGRIDLFESFTKAAVDRLLQETSDRRQVTSLLKSWRDQLIRNLVAEEKAASANRYTRFLDDAAVKLMDPAKKSELQREWLAKVDQFIAGLRSLKEKNQLTSQSIINLTAAPAGKFNVVPLEAVGSVVPGSYRFLVSHSAVPDSLESSRSEARGFLGGRDFLENGLANQIGLLQSGENIPGHFAYAVMLWLNDETMPHDGDPKNKTVHYHVHAAKMADLRTLSDLETQQNYKTNIALTFDENGNLKSFGEIHIKGRLRGQEVPTEEAPVREYDWLADFIAAELKARIGKPFGKAEGSPVPDHLGTLSIDPEDGFTRRSETRSVEEEFQKLTVMVNAVSTHLAAALYDLIRNAHRITEDEPAQKMREIMQDVTTLKHDYFTLMAPEHLSRLRYETLKNVSQQLLNIKERLSKMDSQTQMVFGGQFEAVKENIFKSVKIVSGMLDEIQWPKEGWPQIDKEEAQIPVRLSDLQYVDLVSEVNRHYEELQKTSQSEEHREIKVVYIDAEQWDLAGQTSGPDFDNLSEEITRIQLYLGQPTIQEAEDIGVEAADWIRSNVSGKTIRIRRLQDKEFNDNYFIVLIGKPAGSGPALSEFLPDPSHFPVFWAEYKNYLMAGVLIVFFAAWVGGNYIRNVFKDKNLNVPEQKKLEPARPLAPRSEARQALRMSAVPDSLEPGRSEARADKNFDPEKRKDAEVMVVMRTRESRTAYFRYLVDRGYLPGNIRFEKAKEALKVIEDGLKAAPASDIHLLVIESDLADPSFEAAWKKIAQKKTVKLKVPAQLKEQETHTVFNQKVEPALSTNFPEKFAKAGKAPYDKKKVEEAIGLLLKLIPNEDAYREARSALTRLSSQLSSKQLEIGLAEDLLREVIENESDWLKILEDKQGWHLLADKTIELRNALRLLQETFPPSQQGGAVPLETFYRNAFDLLDALRDLGGAELDVANALESVTELQSSSLSFPQQILEIKKRFRDDHKKELRELGANDGLLNSRSDIVRAFLVQLEKLTKRSEARQALRMPAVPDSLESGRSETRTVEHKDFMDLSKKFRADSFSAKGRDAQNITMEALNRFSNGHFKEAKESLEKLKKHAPASAIPQIITMMEGLDDLQRAKELKAASAPKPKEEVKAKAAPKPDHVPDPELVELRSILHLEDGLFILQINKPAVKVPVKETSQTAEKKKKKEERTAEEKTLKEILAERKAEAEKKAAEAAKAALLAKPFQEKPYDPTEDARRIIDEAVQTDDPQTIAMKLAALKDLPFNRGYKFGSPQYETVDKAVKRIDVLHTKYLQQMLEQNRKARAEEAAQTEVQSPDSAVSFQKLFELITAYPDTFEPGKEGQQHRQEVLLILERVRQNGDAALVQKALDLLRKPFALGRAKTPNGNKASEMLKKLREQASAPAPAKPEESIPAPAAQSVSTLTPEQKKAVQGIVDALLKQINAKWTKDYTAEAFEQILKIEVEALAPQAPETKRSFKITVQGADDEMKTTIHAQNRAAWFLFNRITPSEEAEIKKINDGILGFGPRLYQIYQEALRSGQSPNEPGTPLGQDGLRSELRKESLLMGVHDFEPDAALPNDPSKRHFYPDWWAMRILGQEIYSISLIKRDAVKLEDISAKVIKKIQGHGFRGARYDNLELQILLERMRQEYGLLEGSPEEGYKIAGNDKAFLIRVSHFKAIRGQLEKLLDPDFVGEQWLAAYLKEFSDAVKLWPRFPVESAWPVLRAASTLSRAHKDRLITFLESAKASALRQEPLIDSLLYILTEKISPAWLEDFASSLKGSTLYYISPETWLAAGGLGRVGQYHTLAAKLLMGSDASLVTIEPYYANRLTLSQNSNGEWQEKVVKDVDYTKLPVPVENLRVWKTFEIFVNKKGRRTRVEIEILRGTNKHGIEVFLYRDKPENKGEEPYFTKLLYSYGQHGNAEVEEFTEFASKVSLKLSKKIEYGKKVEGTVKASPTLWANDGQTALLPLFKMISDDLERMSPEELERIKTDPTHEYYEYRDLIQEEDEVSLRDGAVIQTTHTYRNRVIKGPKEFIDGLRLPARYHGYLQSGEWIYLQDGRYQNAFDATSAGVRAAWALLGGANGVAAIHAEEMNPLDKGVELNGNTNGDDRKASRQEFDAAFKSLYSDADSENPEPQQMAETKRVSKTRLAQNEKLNELNPLFAQIDPEKMLITYSGRMVDEKIGDVRAFTAENILALVRAGAQIVLAGNVQSGNAKSREIYLKLKKIEADIAEMRQAARAQGNMTFGLFIVVSGWSIPEQRFLLAASDLQVNDSDRDPKRGTEAAGITETNVMNTGGLEMSSPFLEAIFHQQGEILDWEDPSSGNTIIPESEKPEDYLKAMLKALAEYQKDRLRFAQFQVTSVQFSKILAAMPTAGSYLRQIEEIRTDKKDPEKLWERFFREWKNPEYAAISWFQDSLARLFVHLWENSARNRGKDKNFFAQNLFSMDDAEKVFDPKVNLFGWRKDEKESLLNSDQGLAGMLETFRRLMQTNPRDLWTSLEYHAARNDIFNYLNHELAGLSRAEPVRKKIRALEKEAAKAGLEEKIIKNTEALDLIDQYLQRFSAYLVEEYQDTPGMYLYMGGTKSLGTRFETLFSNSQLSKMTARYLDAAPEKAQRLHTSEKGLRAYWMLNGKPHILLLNTGAITYPDKETGLKKAWGKINLKDHPWIKENLASARRAVQIYDAKRRIDYGFYHAAELEDGLKAGVPAIQYLGLRVKKAALFDKGILRTPSKNALELFSALRDPDPFDPKELESFLPQDRNAAIEKYSEERLPALMSLVAGLTPEHLGRTAGWHPEAYAKLNALLTKNPALFKKGQIAFHAGREGSVVFSRSLGDQNVVFAADLDRSFINRENKKTWFPIRNLGSEDGSKPLFLDPHAMYQIYDLMRGGANNPRAAKNLLRHWDVGIPLEDISFDGRIVQKGWGFDVYQLERMKNLKMEGLKPVGRKEQEPQDLQILEINTRAYFKEHGLKGFSDISIKQLREMKAAGYNALWMMGVYQESVFSKEFNDYWGKKKQVQGGQHASAFAIPDYAMNPEFGGEAAFEKLAERAQKAGIRLILDYIPNHFSLDSPLIKKHPDWFVHMTTPPPDAEKENALENVTGYFKVELKGGRMIWVARATDGLSGAWGDTAQLNYLNPEVWKYMAEKLLYLAKQSNGGGVRVDSLQVLNPEVFRKLWVPYMQPGDFENHMQTISREVFGREPHNRDNVFGSMFSWIKEQYPDFKMIGEVYHGQEGYWQQAGVDITYAKYVYDWIVEGKGRGWQDFKEYVLRQGFHAGLSLDYAFRSLYFLENHDERVRVLKVLAGRLGKNPEDPEAAAWTRLLAAAIVTIPGVPLFYEGQDEGRSRHSTSANWVPDAEWLQGHPDTVIPGMEEFNRSLRQIASNEVFRRGGFAEEIPHAGGNGGVLAFVRRHEGKAGVVVLNHSGHAVDLELDLGLIGKGKQKIHLDAWGQHIEITDDATFERSEVRGLLEEEKAYFQKGEISAQAINGSDFVKEGIFDILQDYIETLRGSIERRQGGEKKNAARAILAHLENLAKRKRVYFIPGILWEDAYFLGRAEKESITVAQGLLSKDIDLGKMVLFRLATLSWLQSENKKPGEQENFLRGFFEFVFVNESDGYFRALHQRYVGLEDRQAIETVLETFSYFHPDGPYFQTEHFFQSWIEAYLRGERFSPAEEAAYLIKKILEKVGEWQSLSAVSPASPDGEFIKKAYFNLILPTLVFAYYRFHFLREMREFVEQRDEEIRRTVRAVVEEVYNNPPITGRELFPLMDKIRTRLDDGKKAASKAIYESALRATLAQYKTEKKETVLSEIENHIYHDPELLRSLDYFMTPYQERHMNLPVEASVEAFKKYTDKVSQLKLRVLISPEHERIQKLLDDHLISINANKKASQVDMLSVPGMEKPVKVSQYKEWIQKFSGRLLDMQDLQSPTGRTLWSTYFSADAAVAYGYFSRVNKIHDVTPFFQVYDMAASPVGEILQAIKAWPDTYAAGGKKVTYQRFPQAIWSDIYNWTGKEDDIVTTSTYHTSTRQFLRALLQVRQNQEPAVYKNKAGYEAYAPGGVDLAPIVQRIMDFSLQLDAAFWTAVHDYYEAAEPEADWSDSYLSVEREKLEDKESETKNFHLWHYSLFTAPHGIFEWLASRLHTSGRRLTPDETRDLLDVLYSLYWSGIPRAERAGSIQFIYQKFIEHVEFYPDGIKIRDLAAFKTFLTEWQKPEYSKDILTGFEKWREDFYAKYPEAEKEKHAEAERPEQPLKPVLYQEPGSAPFALVRLTADPESHLQNPFFSDEEISIEDFFKLDRHPAWKGISSEDKTVLAEVVYENGGIDIPGQPFRYLFEGPAEGARLWGVLIAEEVERDGYKRFVDVFSLTDRGRGGIVYVYQLREKAMQSYGLRGKALRKRDGSQAAPWQKVPDLKKIQPHELGREEVVSKDGFYRISAGEDLISLKWVLGGTEKIHISLPSKTENVLVQAAGSKLLFYTADAGRYLGAIEKSSQSDLRNQSAEDAALLRPAPHALVKQYDFKSFQEYSLAQKLAEKIEPLLKEGVGYDKIDFRDLAEGVYAQIEDKTLVLSRLWLNSETVQTAEGAKTAEETVRALLGKEDARYHMKKALENLKGFWQSEDLYDRTKPVPDLPLSGYTGDLQEHAAEIRNRILAARKIMKAYDAAAFKKFVKPYLKTLLETTTPSDFFMVTRKGTYHGYAGYAQDSLRITDGAGFVTPRNFVFRKDEVEFKNPGGEDMTPYLFFLLPALNGKSGLRIFDRHTGEELTPRHVDLLELQEAKARFIAQFKWENGSQDILREMLEEYLNRLEGDAGVLPQVQMEALRHLAFIPHFQDPGVSEEINLLFVRLIFERLKTEAKNAGGVLKVSGAFNRKPKKVHEDISNLHLALYDLGFENFPSEDFIKEVMIPAVADKKLPSEKSFGSADYFLNLSTDIQNIQGQVRIVLGKDPKAVSEDLSRWINADLVRDHRLSVNVDSIYRYFIRLELAVIRENEEAARRKAEEEAALAKVPMTSVEKKAGTSRVSFMGGAPRKIETINRGNLWPGIGGSSSIWRYKKTSFIIDAGSYIDSVNTVPSYAKWVNEMPRAVFLTHTHTDHIGSVISLLKHLETLQESGKKLPFFYVTRQTYLLLEKALKDIAQDMRRNDREMRRNTVAAGQTAPKTHHVRITSEQAEEFMNLVIPLEANQWYFMQEGEEQIKFRFRPSGHLFGAANLDIATPHARTFGFGDVSKHDQGSFVPGMADWTKEDGRVDTLVWEGTYGMRERADENAEEEKLVRAALESLSKGGKVVIGGFANGRAPREMDIVLKYLFRSESLIPAEERNKIKELRKKYGKFLSRVRILIDGRAAGYVEMVQKDLAESFGHVEILTGSREEQKRRRKQLRDSKEPLIVIASSGNFSYGISRWWAEQLIGPQFKAHDDWDEDKAMMKLEIERVKQKYGNNLIVTAGYADPVEASSRLRETPQGQGALFSFAPGMPSYEVYARVLSAGLAGHISGAESIEFFKQVKQQGGLQRIFLVHGDWRNLEDLKRAIEKTPELDGVKVIIARTGLADQSTAASFRLPRQEWEAYKAMYEGIKASALPEKQVDISSLLNEIHKQRYVAPKFKSQALPPAPKPEPVQPLRIADVPPPVEPPDPVSPVEIAAPEAEEKIEALTDAERELAFKKLIGRLRKSKTVPNVLKSKKAPLITSMELRYLLELIKQGATSLKDPKGGLYSLKPELAVLIREKLTGIKLHQPKEEKKKKRSEVRTYQAFARHLALGNAANQPEAADLAGFVSASRWEAFENGFRKESKKDFYRNLYAVRRWIGTVGVAVDTSAYQEALHGTANGNRHFYVVLTREDLKDDLKLFLEAALLISGPGNHLTLAATDRRTSGKITSELNRLFRRQSGKGIASLHDKISVEFVPPSLLQNKVRETADLSGRLEIVAAQQHASRLLHDAGTMKKVERIVVSDTVLASGRPVEIRDGLLMKARLLVEAALTSKSTNALLAAGANPQLFYADQSLAANISSFLTSLIAAEQKILAAA